MFKIAVDKATQLKRLGAGCILAAILIAILFIRLIIGEQNIRTKIAFEDTKWLIPYSGSEYLYNKDQTEPYKSQRSVLKDLRSIGVSGEFVDPFADNQALQFDFEPLRIWSIGPDGENQGGILLYDPTNGFYSKGDIRVHPRHPDMARKVIKGMLNKQTK